MMAILFGLVAGCAAPPGPKPVQAPVRDETRTPEWSPAKTLRLEDAIGLALRHDPRLETLCAAVEVARVASRAATAPANPEFRGAYQESSSEDSLTGTSEDSEEMQAALRVFPQRPWETRAKAMAGNAALEVARAELGAAEFAVRLEVRAKYAEIAHLDKDLEALERVAAARKDRYEALKAAAAEGQATTVDVLGAGLDYSDALARQGEAEGSRRRASRSLATMIGAGQETGLKVRAADLKRSTSIPDSDAAYLQQFAMEHRMDLRAAEWRARRAWAEWRRARAVRVPWFSYLQAGYGEEVGGNSEAWSAQFGVELPIFTDPGAGHQVMAAEWAMAKAWEAEVRADVSDDVLDALELLKEVDDDLRRFERDMVPLIDELTGALTSARESRSLSLDTAAQIEVRLAEAERARLDIENRLEQALLALETALGAELPQVTESETVVEAVSDQ